MTKKQKAEEIRNLYLKSNNGWRQKWHKQEQQSYEYSLGEQLTKDEMDDLKSAGMPTFTIDMISPVISLMKYFVTAEHPRWNAVGAEGSDIDVAHVYATMTEYMWYWSDGSLQYSQIIDNSFRKSKGYFHFYIDSNADRGMGEVLFRSENPFHVYVDPMSKDPLERDATFKILKSDYPKSQLINMLPQYKNQILSASGAEDSNGVSVRDTESSIAVLPEDYVDGINPKDGKEDEIIPYYEVYRKIRVPYVKVFVKIPPTSDKIKAIKKEVDLQVKELTQELQVQLKEKAQELKEKVETGEILQERADLEIEKAQNMGRQALNEQKQILYSKAVDANSQVEEKIMPEKEYDIIAQNNEIAKNIVFAKKYFETRIQRSGSVGNDTLLYEYVMDISEYPLIPLCFEHVGTPYSISAVSPLAVLRDFASPSILVSS